MVQLHQDDQGGWRQNRSMDERPLRRGLSERHTMASGTNDSDDPGGEGTLNRMEVARLFLVSPSTVTRWARQGKIPVLRTPGGHYRYPAAPLRRMAGHAPEAELDRLD